MTDKRAHHRSSQTGRWERGHFLAFRDTASYETPTEEARLSPEADLHEQPQRRQAPVVLRIHLLRAIQRILQRDDRRRRRRSLRLHELHVWSLKKKNRDRENARHSISPLQQS